MSENSHDPRRDRLSGSVASVIALLPRMGKVMIIGQKDGVTHERIGPVETVTAQDGLLRLGGACHDAEIGTDRVAEITLDTSSVMRGKIYPRLEFLTTDGATAFAIVGMDGLEPFVTPLAELDRTALPLREKPATTVQDRSDLDPADPVYRPLQSALDRQDPVSIHFDNGILRQGWSGRIEALKPAMGFLNVMTPDFHLHLKGGSFSGWQPDEQKGLVALDAAGEATTLSLATETAQ